LGKRLNGIEIRGFLMKTGSKPSASGWMWQTTTALPINKIYSEKIIFMDILTTWVKCM